MGVASEARYRIPCERFLHSRIEAEVWHMDAQLILHSVLISLGRQSEDLKCDC